MHGAAGGEVAAAHQGCPAEEALETPILPGRDEGALAPVCFFQALPQIIAISPVLLWVLLL